MNEKQLREKLLKNYCQIGNCGTVLEQYEIFCKRHWLLAPIWARYRYQISLKRLELNKGLDRTEAWKRVIQRLGIQEATYFLGQHRQVIELLKELIKAALGIQYGFKVRASKWDKNNRFKESYSTDRI